jgi:hypothetical protein
MHRPTHPRTVRHDGLIDAAAANGAAPRRSSVESNANTSASSPQRASLESSRHTLVSPRPRVSRTSGAVRTWSCRQSTPLSGRTSKAGVITPHPSSRASTLAQNSTRDSAQDRTSLPPAARGEAAGAAARVRRRSTFLTGPTSLMHSDRASKSPPPRHLATSTKVGSPYRAPSTVTATLLALKTRTTRSKTSLQSSTAKNNAETAADRRRQPTTGSVVSCAGPTDSARADPNEPFSDNVFVYEGRARQRSYGASSHPHPLTTGTTPTRGAAADPIVNGATSTKGQVPPHVWKRPSLSLDTNRSTEEEEGERKEPAAIKTLRDTHIGREESAFPRGCFPACPPLYLCRLPRCSEEERLRLFSSLSYDSRRGTHLVWSLHRHVLPFLAARASAIMPASIEQIRVFLGDQESTACVDGAYAEKMWSSSSPQALTQFASELCAWFFYVGVLDGGECLSWETSFGEGLTVALDGAAAVAGATNARAATPRSPRRSVGASAATLKRSVQRQSTWYSSSEDSSSSSPSTDLSPTGLPCVLRPHNSDNAKDEDDEDKEGTVLWQTTRWEQSAEGASSTVASMEFRSVVEVPPYVEAAAFVRGYGVLQRLLEERATASTSITAAATACPSVEAGTDKEGKPSSLPSHLCADLHFATTSHSNRVVKDVGEAALHENSNLQRVTAHVSPRVRAGLQQAVFYLRLHAFLLQLCLLQRAKELAPSQRDSQLIEAVLRSRLSRTATAGTATDDMQKQRRASSKEKEKEKEGDGVRGIPRRCRWLGRHLLHRGLHEAILRVSPVASRSASDGRCAPTHAVDTLEALLTLRRREVERVVRSAVRTDDRSVLGADFALPAHTCVATEAEAEAARGRALLPSILLLFPLPQWSPWQQSQRRSTATSRTLSGRTQGWAPLGMLTAAALVTLLPCLLVYCVLLSSTWEWGEVQRASVDDHVHGNVSSVEAGIAVLHHPLGPLILAPVLVLTCYVGHRLGALVSVTAVQLQLVASQAARLATASTTWLFSAWALRVENVVAAAASQRCVTRLGLALRAAEAVYDDDPTTRSFSLAACAARMAALSILLCAVQATAFLPRRIMDGIVVLAMAVPSSCRVWHSWRRHQRVLDWWLQRQTSLAEGFAHDVLREVALTDGWTMKGKSVDGQTLLQPSSAPLSRAATLYVIPLPLLEELARVGWVMHVSQHANTQRRPRHGKHVEACVALRLLEFPLHCFWDQLCGCAAVAYMGGTSAISVVERVNTACAGAAQELWARPTPHHCSAVASLLQLMLPWVGNADVPWPHAAGTREKGDEEEEEQEVTEVLAPVSSHPLQWREGIHVLQAPFSPHSPSGRGCAFAEEPISLDVRPCRSTYLTVPQRRLLVCAAVVFAELQMQPPALSANREATTGIEESTLECLAHLVYSQLTAEHDGTTTGSAPLRWNEAERRAHEALHLVQRAAVSMRLRGGPGDRCTTDLVGEEKGEMEGRYSLLPQLVNLLFRPVIV